MTDTYYEDDYIDYEEEQTGYETEPDLLIADETRAERMAEISRKAPFMSKWLMVLFVVMIASGSEVSTLVEGAEMLQKEGIQVRVVSVPSEGLFRDQPKSYQDSILLSDVPRYGLTSGLSMTLRGLVGENGKIHGLDHFGYSAPYKVLDEKFGYNGQAVYEEVKAMLNKN